MSQPFTDWPDMLAAIREKPGLYTGRRSVERLHCLLNGWQFAELHYDVPVAKRLGGFDFNAFEDWIAARYNPEELSVGSYWLAGNAAGSDEAGFGLWFQWYDEFRAAAATAAGAVG
jgi:hypothetical protein